MGFFCLECLAEIEAKGAFWLTRLPEGTLVADARGRRLEWEAALLGSKEALHEWEVRIGAGGKVRGRLVAARIDPARANERRRKLRESLHAKGRVPSAIQLALCDWVVVFTNAPSAMLPAAEAARLYRARWMVETFFKGLKSGQGLEEWSRHRTNGNAILCLGYAHLILAVLSLNLWRVLGRIASLGQTGPGDGADRARDAEQTSKGLRTVGVLMAMPLLMETLSGLISGRLNRRDGAKKLCNDARYSTQEFRARQSLDSMLFGPLT